MIVPPLEDAATFMLPLRDKQKSSSSTTKHSQQQWQQQQQLMKQSNSSSFFTSPTARRNSSQQTYRLTQFSKSPPPGAASTTTTRQASMLTDDLRRRFSVFIEAAADTQLSSFLVEVLQRYEALSNEYLRSEKQNIVLNSQLAITKDVLSQREMLMQQMREDHLNGQRNVKKMEKEQESSRVRFERFTKQNNDNFFKVAQKIKDSVSIQSQKQQDQINYLKQQLVIQQNNHTHYFNPNGYLLPAPTAAPATTPLQTISTQQNSNVNNSNILIPCSSRESTPRSNGGGGGTSDLPNEAKLESLRRFFAETDLKSTNNIGNSSSGGLTKMNSFRKLQMSKQKLHSMFMFKTSVFSGTSTPKAIVKKGSNSSNNNSQKELPVPGIITATAAAAAPSPKAQPPTMVQPVIATPVNSQTGGLRLKRQDSMSMNARNPNEYHTENLKTAQKQFNKALNINFHHMRASSLAEEFFQFKGDASSAEDRKSPEKSSESSKKQKQTVHNPRARSDFLQHASDYHFYTLLLDLNKTDKSIMKAHRENPQLSYLRNVGINEQSFLKFMMDLTAEKYQSFFDSVQATMQHEYASFTMILKLKKIILSVQKMHSSLLLTDAFTTIIDETCSVLGCERSSVFLIDPRRDELWTKVAKDSKPIRVPIGKGFVGAVAKTGEMLNILDAHQDSRFNREIDLKNNYRTKSVLCVPIRDSNFGSIIGVLQAINKKDENFFTKEDEGLIMILAQLATAVLRNSLYHDEREVFHNSVQILLDSGLDFQGLSTQKAVMLRGQQILTDKFDCPSAAVWLYESSSSQLVRYSQQDDDSTEEGTVKQTCRKGEGLIGHVFDGNSSESTLNAYEHPLFNGQVDINTSLPLITMVIKKVNKSDRFSFQKIGVLQCANPKGLQSLVFHQKSNKNVTDTFCETLDHFSAILGDALVNKAHKMDLSCSSD